MTVQQLSDRLLELSHQHGLAQANVCFVRDKEPVDVDDIYVLNNNIIVLCTDMEALALSQDTEIAGSMFIRNNQTGGDWVVRDKEPL